MADIHFLKIGGFCFWDANNSMPILGFMIPYSAITADRYPTCHTKVRYWLSIMSITALKVGWRSSRLDVFRKVLQTGYVEVVLKSTYTISSEMCVGPAMGAPHRSRSTWLIFGKFDKASRAEGVKAGQNFAWWALLSKESSQMPQVSSSWGCVVLTFAMDAGVNSGALGLLVFQEATVTDRKSRVLYQPIGLWEIQGWF